MGHVATEHRAPLAPPGIQPELPAGTQGLTTLRSRAPEARHHHGEHGHSHSARPGAHRTVRVHAPEAPLEDGHSPEASGDNVDHTHGHALPDGFHAHGHDIHRHDAPPAHPAPVVLTLDKHRLPLASTLTPPPAQATAWAARGDGHASAETRVETPPPRERG
ncbi:hypothetical protein BSZ36_01055 [Rubricoccus marinus]|uniref:Uncharacterized protein n=1 Tax=Rubricoccus marinus TaxID=716817 RepID=A0A259TVA0_9BACT|nr:hypothetical protein BSZ36_01055 [Rubricoccus marinus]